MASANYASSDNSEEIKLCGQDVNLVGTDMERDMSPLVNTWDQESQVSEWSTTEEDLRTSGAGVETLRESEQLKEAEGFKKTTEGGNDKTRESGEDSLGVTGQGEPGKVLTSLEVTISSSV